MQNPEPPCPNTTATPSQWHSEYQLPVVSGEHANLQVVLGGIHLILSRVNPEFARDRYAHTRQLAKLLTSITSRPVTSLSLLTTAELRAVASEVESVIDPGTRLTLARLIRETQAAESQRKTTDGVQVSELSASAFMTLSNL